MTIYEIIEFGVHVQQPVTLTKIEDTGQWYLWHHTTSLSPVRFGKYPRAFNWKGRDKTYAILSSFS
jgi:hypothetical protein